MLQAHGVADVSLLNAAQLAREEPALALPPGAAGLLVHSDAQIVRFVERGWQTSACC